jgi:hypothetical protein
MLKFLAASALAIGFGASTCRAQEGAFDLYVAAARAIMPAKPPVDGVNDSKNRPPREQAQLYTSARRTAFLRTNRRAFDLFERAQKTPLRPRTGRSVTSEFPNYGKLREFARVKSIEAKEWKWRGKWEKALDSGLDTLQMGRAIEDPRNDSPILNSLVGIAVQAIGANFVRDVPPHLSATEATRGAARLEAILDDTPRYSQVLQRDLWLTRTEMLQHITPKNSKSPATTQPEPRLGKPKKPLTREEVLQEVESINAAIEPIIAQADWPVGAILLPPDFTKIETYEETDSVAVYYPQMARRGIWNYARRKATNQNLLLRLALRAYRLENGTYPEKISQLAPKYLKKVPVDPFGKGEIWRYKRNGDTFLAWSVGPDGKDDGGKSIPPRKNNGRVIIMQDSKGDWIARP